MTIIGFNMTKIDVERKKDISGKVNISNNVAIKNIEKIDIALGNEKQQAAKFVYEFISTYTPEIGSIKLAGDVIYMESAETIKGLIDGWKDNKDVPKEVMAQILNHVLSKCNIEALLLSREVNLPPPIPLPKVQEVQKKDENTGKTDYKKTK